MPNRSELNFPGRSKRKAMIETLRELKQNPQLAQNESFQKYVTAFEKLDRIMDEKSALNEQGLPKLLNTQDADEIAAALAETGQAGEEYLAAAEYAAAGQVNAEPNATALLVTQLQGLLAKDFEAVKNYKPEEKTLSLDEIQETARTKTIDLRGRTLGSVTNQQNERILMSVVNAKGEKRPGVFTKKTKMQVKESYDAAMGRVKAACGNNPQANEALDKFLNNFRMIFSGQLKNDNGTKLRDRSSDCLTIGFLVKELYNQFTTNDITPEQAEGFLSSVGVVCNANGITKNGLKVLAKELTALKNKVAFEVNALNAEIPDGSRLDNRNAAATAVCDVLGFGDLLARSESMRFIGDNGEVTEGTFMDYGKGIDLYQKPSLFRHVLPKRFGSIDNRNRLFKQISDMQVLDYICMNCDRHAGNVFYQVDAEGNITGIQGIDNDSSFGPARQHKLRAAELGVVTTSTAKKIQEMNPSMLRFALRGRGLSEKELTAAVARLQDLQQAIAEKKLPVVADDQIGRRDISTYFPKGKDRDNLFKNLDEYTKKMVQATHDATTKHVPMPDQGTPKLREVELTERRGTVYGLTDSLNKVSRLVRNDEKKFRVEDLTKTFRGSSQYFKDMVTAARTAMQLRTQILSDETMDKSALAMEAGSVDTFRQVNESFDTLEQRAMEYLQYKLDHSKVRPKPQSLDELRGKNEYEQKHIDYARDILKTVNDYRQSQARPETEAEKEVQQANQQRRELEKRRAEAAGPQL